MGIEIVGGNRSSDPDEDSDEDQDQDSDSGVDIRTHTLDQFLSAYGLSKTDDAKNNPRAAIVRRVVIEPTDLEGLSSNDPRLANFSTCPNSHHHKIYTCQNCDVHGCQADEASNDAKRGILFENLSVGAVWLSLWGGHGNGNGNVVQHGGVLVVGGNTNQGTRGVVPRGGGVLNSAGGTNRAAATGASNLEAGAGTGGGGRLILTQGIQRAQDQGSGANGVIPNRLNNNNIGLARPANHNSHANVSRGRLVGRRSNLRGS
ncbi:hypothetical protein DID88_000288 [Monilinia fructigena]|uniref:Uncharacterized protein n=1 Tax=Monilinia fructigena TaxID=38457 RepID=A0A395IH39_9HELO|nr:hypothetical protein DID88_000288 [Monilinia fructigena]